MPRHRAAISAQLLAEMIVSCGGSKVDGSPFIDDTHEEVPEAEEPDARSTGEENSLDQEPAKPALGESGDGGQPGDTAEPSVQPSEEPDAVSCTSTDLDGWELAVHDARGNVRCSWELAVDCPSQVSIEFPLVRMLTQCVAPDAYPCDPD